ncbi:MAG: hypothetical protein F6K11_15355 [Leptolyngbya sp. SIO3F4]|nr:hypothetical protein [Leptolyngbya sp. SIO3F4]
MTLQQLTHHSQSNSLRSVAIKVATAKENSGSFHGIPLTPATALTSDISSQQELMKKQEVMDKEYLAPSWVWEYGVMG